jgi:hypothetical protein
MIRSCRICKKELPASRYFKCIKCQPELSSTNEDYIFETPTFDEHLEKMFEETTNATKNR